MCVQSYYILLFWIFFSSFFFFVLLFFLNFTADSQSHEFWAANGRVRYRPQFDWQSAPRQALSEMQYARRMLGGNESHYFM